MLVLTRKLNESIVIDGSIEVMVVQVGGNRVRLGFRAPADVSIQRKERLPVVDDRIDGHSGNHEMHAPVAVPLHRFRIAARPR
jgi:carbon storage regulator